LLLKAADFRTERITIKGWENRMSHNTEQERVRANTAEEINWRIDQRIEENVRLYLEKPQEDIARRIWELEREWDIERVLETMAASFSLTGIGLSIAVDRRWILLPGAVLSFLLLHAFQGWCPPVPILRRLGVRTREEIDRELYALKALIGNFPRSSGELSAEAAFGGATK
jgi:hypothetical protein